MSKAKARETRKYWPLRRKFLEDHPYCEVPDRVHDCGFYSSTVHHMKGQQGEMMNEIKWWLAACLAGHAWIEDHKKEARKMGLILYK